MGYYFLPGPDEESQVLFAVFALRVSNYKEHLKYCENIEFPDFKEYRPIERVGFLRLSSQDRFSIYMQHMDNPLDLTNPSRWKFDFGGPYHPYVDSDQLHQDPLSLVSYVSISIGRPVIPTLALVVTTRSLIKQKSREPARVRTLNQTTMYPMIPLFLRLWEENPTKKIHWDYFYMPKGNYATFFQYVCETQSMVKFIYPGRLLKELQNTKNSPELPDLWEKEDQLSRDFDTMEQEEYDIWSERVEEMRSKEDVPDLFKRSRKDFEKFYLLFESETDRLEDLLQNIKKLQVYFNDEKNSPFAITNQSMLQEESISRLIGIVEGQIYGLRSLYCNYLVCPDMYPILFPWSDLPKNTSFEQVIAGFPYLLKKNCPWNLISEKRSPPPSSNNYLFVPYKKEGSNYPFDENSMPTGHHAIQFAKTLGIHMEFSAFKEFLFWCLTWFEVSIKTRLSTISDPNSFLVSTRGLVAFADMIYILLDSIDREE